MWRIFRLEEALSAYEEREKLLVDTITELREQLAQANRQKPGKNIDDELLRRMLNLFK